MSAFVFWKDERKSGVCRRSVGGSRHRTSNLLWPREHSFGYGKEIDFCVCLGQRYQIVLYRNTQIMLVTSHLTTYDQASRDLDGGNLERPPVDKHLPDKGTIWPPVKPSATPKIHYQPAVYHPVLPADRQGVQYRMCTTRRLITPAVPNTQTILKAHSSQLSVLLQQLCRRCPILLSLKSRLPSNHRMQIPSSHFQLLVVDPILTWGCVSV